MASREATVAVREVTVVVGGHRVAFNEVTQ